MPAPSLADALTQAAQQFRAGNAGTAERLYRQALAADPSNADVWCHLATCCLVQNRLDDAVAAYEKAILHQPQFPEALNNLAVALSRLNRIDQAIKCFSRAAAQRPNWAEPFISLGNLHLNHDQMDLAAQSFACAVQAEPNNAEAHNLLASTIGKQGLREQAIAHFVEAIRLQPRYTEAHSNLLMALNYDPHISPEELLIEHRWWDRLHGQGLTEFPPHQNDRNPDRPLKVGYVSPDFRHHVAAGFILPIFEAHDPQQVQLFGYAEVAQPDTTTERFRARCHAWRSTCGKTDAQVAEQIRADGIDILVDLAGHTGGNRLGAFARRPAPMQISYLGYPNTTGLSAMGYRITDEIADPKDAQHSEHLVRLPGCWCCWSPPANAPEVAALPMQSNGRVTFGLTHKPPKLNEVMIPLFARVLKSVPGSRLLIFRNTLDESTKQRLLKAFAEQGIAADRLELASGSARDGAHLAVYSRIDISLDSLPWSGHATTCESLWMGVPMVTLRGDRHAGRMSASIITAVGLAELIAENADQYVEVATKLARDFERLSRLRSELRVKVKASPLCDAIAFTRQLESAYRAIWRQWCAQAAKS